jgi:hypothetical protein
MPSYRVYRVGPDQHIIGVEVVHAAADEEALAAAKKQLDRHTLEVWANARFLGRLHPDPQP